MNPCKEQRFPCWPCRSIQSGVIMLLQLIEAEGTVPAGAVTWSDVSVATTRAQGMFFMLVFLQNLN